MTSMQIKSLIRNMAKEKNINAQILLRNYMLVSFKMQTILYFKNFLVKYMVIAPAINLNNIFI